MLSWFTEITVRRSISLFPSSSQNRVRSKNCVTRFCDQSEYHHCCTSVSLSVWFIRTSLVPCLCYSKSQEWPTTARKPASILRNFYSVLSTFFCIVVPSQHKISEHWHEDDSAVEVLTHTLYFSWIFESLRGMPNVVNPAKIFHSSSVCIPSMRLNSLT